MKRFIPLIIWFVLSVPFLYFVKHYLVYKFPKHAHEILMLSASIVIIVFFVLKDYVLSYPKKKDGRDKHDE